MTLCTSLSQGNIAIRRGGFSLGVALINKIEKR